MAEQVHKSRRDKETDTGVDAVAIQAEGSRDVSASSSDIEQILDEIDDVLEANAEDFVRNYVQKGGQ